MLKSIIAIERDGMDVRILPLLFEVPNKEFDLKAAVKKAATDYCMETDEGRSIYAYNCSCFNWADFEANIPQNICEKYGFKIVELPDTIEDEIVNWDEHLVDDSVIDEDNDEFPF